ncbi:hypothetical protein [Brenneria izbisi]|uniref:Uncharacterized protein n=1 Tax=Brenneria izbisi TaxID=2939450 RepID=A0AA41XV77_9GAMM|nr:hypothetical protein [Brenneria izbisi]MCV9879363.1 hypothetical protein [Brenneria izbisi]MCV9882563.1 hypothetical protein [Brenneria izbisi]
MNSIADNHEGYQQEIALEVVPNEQVYEPASTGCVQGVGPPGMMMRACYAEMKKAVNFKTAVKTRCRRLNKFSGFIPQIWVMHNAMI